MCQPEVLRLLCAPLPGTEGAVPPYGTTQGMAWFLLLLSAGFQHLLWRRGRRLWLRLLPLWLSGGLAAGCLLCVIGLYRPYAAGFALFLSLAALAGALAGLVLGWLWKRNQKK